jgi:small-conductance mechanosensitive channel
MRKDKEKDKKATVFIKELGENGIVLKSTIYTRNIDDNYIACSDIRKELKKQFDLAGIRMYFKRVRVIN